MNTKLEMAFFVLAGLVILVELFWLFRTEKRLKKFFLGKKGKDLEETIEKLSSDILSLKSANEKSGAEIAVMNKKLAGSIRGLETVRFNPFPDQGSNQSFAIGMVDEGGDGVVLSSLYARERMSVFAKPVKGGKSEYELTEEEKEALWKAKKKTE
ncbi:MAG: DUF4446 family protein [Patescibacteria group bacterium]